MAQRDAVIFDSEPHLKLRRYDGSFYSIQASRRRHNVERAEYLNGIVVIRRRVDH
jgi:hypothetical protein